MIILYIALGMVVGYIALQVLYLIFCFILGIIVDLIES